MEFPPHKGNRIERWHLHVPTTSLVGQAVTYRFERSQEMGDPVFSLITADKYSLLSFSHEKLKAM